MSDRIKKLAEKLGGFQYVLIVAAVGLALMLPSSGQSDKAPDVEREEELRIAALLTQIEGVGAARVLLSENGAVVVCQGAENVSVCLRITQAVRCYTGLGADEVQIFKME